MVDDLPCSGQAQIDFLYLPPTFDTITKGIQSGLFFSCTGWHENYPDNPLFNPVGMVNRLVSEGKLGMKTGEGFYSHQKK